MKKFFLGALALMFLTVISCKQASDKAEEVKEEAKEVAEEVAEKAEEVKEEVAEKVEEVTEGVPNFSDTAVQEYVDTYEKYISEYEKIVESKDMTAFASLGQKGQELATKAQEISGKLTGEDAQKWTEYMTSTSKRLQELATKMTQQ
ncbi:hypothetical protein [Aquimarina sp. 2201CG5-10]|uniref:hypothetical protein n=1 Tax=Aquimarina callyspongiae TaxID=3098150 RepID=UPI002AB36509|nr:hypothetical protein [Aquimarina sp. 2201CG5-10]MDY8136594.1 hypothetical protein [Aquimarina sp. 2201CG5-10]